MMTHVFIEDKDTSVVPVYTMEIKGNMVILKNLQQRENIMQELPYDLSPFPALWIQYVYISYVVDVDLF